MEKKRARRIAFASLTSVAIALGGFYTGYARSGPEPDAKPADVKPAFLEKLPPNVNLAILISKGSALGFTTAEIQAAKNASQKELADFLAEQRAHYARSLRRIELAEEGKILNWALEPGVSDIATLRWMQKEDKPLDDANARLQIKVAKSLGKKNRLVVAEQSKYRSWATMPKNAEIFLKDETIDQLGLTQVQKNQLVLLTAGIAGMAANPTLTLRKPLEYDEEFPRIAEHRNYILTKAKGHKSYFYGQAMKLLSPKQALILDNLVRNSEYVQP